MHLFRGQLRKLIRRPATRWSLVALGGLLVLVYGAVVGANAQMTDPESREGLEALLTFPDAYELLLSVLITLGGMAAATYAGMVRGGDFVWRTFGTVVARGESRNRYVAAEFLAVALLAGVAFVLLLAFGVVLAAVGSLALGYGATGIADPDTLVNLGLTAILGWYSIAIQASFGLAAAAVTRSPLAGVVVIVALYFVEQLAPIVVPVDLLVYAPLAATAAVASGSRDLGTATSAEDLLKPLLIASAYFAAALVVAFAASRRAELE